MSPLAATADEQLMRAYATGQAAAFETLYDRHSARVWRYILRSTGDAAAADARVIDGPPPMFPRYFMQ